MRVLGPIVQISALSVLDARKQLTPSDTITPQLVGHDHPWDVLQTLQKPPEEALRGAAIAPGLNQDVEHNTILIDRAPKVLPHALDPDEDFVQVPLVPWPRPVAAQAVSETRTEFLAPASHRKDAPRSHPPRTASRATNALKLGACVGTSEPEQSSGECTANILPGIDAALNMACRGDTGVLRCLYSHSRTLAEGTPAPMFS